MWYLITTHSIAEQDSIQQAVASISLKNESDTQTHLRNYSFVYLRKHPSPPCRFANVYNLEITDDSVVHESEFYTLSAEGINRTGSDGIVGKSLKNIVSHMN